MTRHQYGEAQCGLLWLDNHKLDMQIKSSFHLPYFLFEHLAVFNSQRKRDLKEQQTFHLFHYALGYQKYFSFLL